MQPETVRASYTCPTCGFDLWLPVAMLDVSTLGLYNDARFPGRGILALHEHHEDLSEVSPAILSRFVRDVQRAGRAIKVAAAADRMNYAVLGNVAPHVHFHLIPRVIANDPVPHRPPWEHPAPVSPLSPGEVDRLSDAIAEVLRAETN